MENQRDSFVRRWFALLDRLELSEPAEHGPIQDQLRELHVEAGEWIRQQQPETPRPGNRPGARPWELIEYGRAITPLDQTVMRSTIPHRKIFKPGYTDLQTTETPSWHP